jgi:hypothetical protein
VHTGIRASSSRGHSDPEDLALLEALDRLTGEEGGLRPEDILVTTRRGQEKSRWYRAERRTIGNHPLRWIGTDDKWGSASSGDSAHCSRLTCRNAASMRTTRRWSSC